MQNCFSVCQLGLLLTTFNPSSAHNIHDHQIIYLPQSGTTAITYARQCSHQEIVDILKDSGAVSPESGVSNKYVLASLNTWTGPGGGI